MVPGGASSRSREIVSFDIDPVLLSLGMFRVPAAATLSGADPVRFERLEMRKEPRRTPR
jgi:hypothetical protein